MKLNQQQLNILQSIQKGYSSNIAISKHLDLDIALIGYDLDQMQYDGYVDVQNIDAIGSLQPTKLVSLTDKGVVALKFPDKL